MNDGQPSTSREVVVTGIGVISAVGCDLDTFWKAVSGGNSGAKSITRFDASSMPTRIAAEIRNFEPQQYMPLKKARRYDLCTQYAIAAAMDAAADAGLSVKKMSPDRLGVVSASSLEGMETAFRGHPDFLAKGYKVLGPSYLINNYSGAGSGEIALSLGAQGHALTVSTGSSSGSDAIGLAAGMIRGDQVDAIIVGGSETPILSPIVGGFCKARLTTQMNDAPKSAMRPFDKSKDGFLLGEGAAFLVLEEKMHALARSARIYAELPGEGRSCEAYHSVDMQPQGSGLVKALEKAFKAARIKPSQVQYINAHATATSQNDVVESRAIKHFFGPHAWKMAVSGTKPITGHLLAAAGAIESAICCLTIHHQMIPPTINLRHPLEECDLDYVSTGARGFPVDFAVNLSSGFGGKNSCLIFKKHSRS